MNGVTDRPTLKSSTPGLRHTKPDRGKPSYWRCSSGVSYVSLHTISTLYFLLLLFLLHRSFRSWCHPHFHLNQVSEGLIHQAHRNSPSIRLVGPCLGQPHNVSSLTAQLANLPTAVTRSSVAPECTKMGRFLQSITFST